jgi:hypothetical protein
MMLPVLTWAVALLQMIVKVAALGMQLFFPITILACLVRKFMCLSAPAICSHAKLDHRLNFHDVLKRLLGPVLLSLVCNWSCAVLPTYMSQNYLAEQHAAGVVASTSTPFSRATMGNIKRASPVFWYVQATVVARMSTCSTSSTSSWRVTPHLLLS